MVLTSDDVRRRIAAQDLAGLKRALAAAPSAAPSALWEGLSPFERIVCFKLLDPGRAVALFETLPAAALGPLLGARERGVVAPLLEDMPAAEADLLFPPMSDEVFERLAARARACT